VLDNSIFKHLSSFTTISDVFTPIKVDFVRYVMMRQHLMLLKIYVQNLDAGIEKEKIEKTKYLHDNYLLGCEILFIDVGLFISIEL